MDLTFQLHLEAVNARLKSRQHMAVLLLEQPLFFEELIRIATSSNHKLALQAIWTIEQALVIHPLSLCEYVELFIKSLPETHEDSNLRSIAKICSIILKIPMLKSRFDLIPQRYKLHMVHCNFIWFTAPYRVAVKVHAMENLSSLITIEEWIKPNLIDIIELHYPTQSAAYKARARTVLKRLKKLN